MKRILPAICLAVLLSWGCQKKPAAVIPASTPAPAVPESAPAAVTPAIVHTAEPVPAPLPKTISSPDNLELGRKSYLVGNYPQTIKSCEEYLQENPTARERDQCLFLLGISLALSNDSARNLRQAQVALKRLISEFPTSPYRPEAEFFLEQQGKIERLQSDVREREERIKKLTEELQILKEIDLQRRPSRPE